MAGFRSADAKARSDGLIGIALGSPPTEFQSAFNVLANGAQSVDGAARQIRPLSKDDLEQQVSRLVQQGLSSGAIAQRLAATSGSGGLKQLNKRLLMRRGQSTSTSKKLPKCYHVEECRNGTRAAELCRLLWIVQRHVEAINERARRIPGIMVNSSGAPPIIGGGALDLEFNTIRTPNVDYLAGRVCT
jgi:hypothetical protein